MPPKEPVRRVTSGETLTHCSHAPESETHAVSKGAVSLGLPSTWLKTVPTHHVHRYFLGVRHQETMQTESGRPDR